MICRDLFRSRFVPSCRFGVFRIAVVVALSAAWQFAAPPPAKAYQSCGMLVPSAMATNAACSGPMFRTGGLVDYRSFFGINCGAGCAKSGNAFACIVGPNELIASFLDSPGSNTDTTMKYCNFMCGVRGNCTIRGGDGLPVELMRFGVE